MKWAAYGSINIWKSKFLIILLSEFINFWSFDIIIYNTSIKWGPQSKDEQEVINKAPEEYANGNKGISTVWKKCVFTYYYLNKEIRFGPLQKVRHKVAVLNEIL